MKSETKRPMRLPNNGVNATVCPVTPLACASVAPVRLARYAVCYAYQE